LQTGTCNGYHIVLISLYAYQFYVFYHFNILIIPMRAMHTYISVLDLWSEQLPGWRWHSCQNM